MSEDKGAVEVVIEEEHGPFAVLTESERGGRPITEILLEAKQRNSTLTLAEVFGKDIEEIVANHQQPWNPPSWD